MKKKNMMRRMACSFAAKYAVNGYGIWRFEKQAILSLHEKKHHLDEETNTIVLAQRACRWCFHPPRGALR